MQSFEEFYAIHLQIQGVKTRYYLNNVLTRAGLAYSVSLTK